MLLDDEDYLRLAGRRLSVGSHGYAQLWEPATRRMITVHRWVLGALDKTGFSFVVDHINRQPLDCRRHNLRKVSPTESNLNRQITQRDLPTGVYRYKTWYHVKIKRWRVTHWVGAFEDLTAAVTAKDKWLAENG